MQHAPYNFTRKRFLVFACKYLRSLHLGINEERLNLKPGISMGTFIGHLIPGLAFALLGLWHTFNTIKVYHVKGAAKFEFRFWYPFKCPFFIVEHLELVIICSSSVLAIFMQILDFPYLNFAFKLDNFEHATMFLHLTIFAGFTLMAELSRSSQMLSSVSRILATSVFGQELFLIHYHSADHVGLEGHYHWLMQLIVFVSLMAALATTVCPTSFPAALILSISVVFQGCWFVNMGFMLWVPEFVPQGCKTQGMVTCETSEADLRARALANLQFSWILSGILIFMGCLCLKFSRNSSSDAAAAVAGHSIEYEQLHSRVDVLPPVAINVFKQDHP